MDSLADVLAIHHPDFSERFKPYVVTYWSNMRPITTLAEGLRDVLDAMGPSESFGTKPFVFVAHSMGGLVARHALFQRHRTGAFENRFVGDRLLRLITLGTPHHGSPLANGSPVLLASGAVEPLVTAVHALMWTGGVTSTTPNRSDLTWDNYDGRLAYWPNPAEQNFNLAALNSFSQFDSKLVRTLGRIPGGLFGLYPIGASALRDLGSDFQSDGVVPIKSATFEDGTGTTRAAFTRLFNEDDHSEMVSGAQDRSCLSLNGRFSCVTVAPGQADRAGVGKWKHSERKLDARSRRGPSVLLCSRGQEFVGERRLRAKRGPRDLRFGGCSKRYRDYIRVTAINAAGSSISEETIVAVGAPCLIPGAPTGLTASASGSTVVLSWGAALGAPIAYLIEAGSASGLNDLANVDTGNALTGLTATGVTDGRYFLRVRARNSCGTGPPSNEFVLTVTANPARNV